MSIIVDPIVQLLLFLTRTIESLGIPYSFGFGIIALTVLLKIITYPLSLQQIRSMKAMQAIQPRMAELQKKYGKDRERMAQEQMKLYREAGVNPLGGCLPLLIQLPILWALFGALRHPDLNAVANSSFFIIKDLHCPSCAEWPQGGPLGLGWLLPFPPAVGWEVALPYLLLPVLLFGTQLLMQRYQMMTTPSSSGSPNMSMFNTLFSVMFAYYTLILPASLSIYYITFNLLTVAQQYLALRADGGRPALATAGSNGKSASVLASLPTPKPTARPQTEPAVEMEVQSNSDDGSAAGEDQEKPIRRTRRRKRK